MKTTITTAASFFAPGETITIEDPNGKGKQVWVVRSVNNVDLVVSDNWLGYYWMQLKKCFWRMRRILTTNPFHLILGWLLFHANRNPIDRDTFYPLKDKLLHRWGKRMGDDLQHLEGLRCNRCNNGRHWHWVYDMHAFGYEPCWHCNGTGWFKPERWVLLNRYKLGTHEFHLPICELTALRGPMKPPTRLLNGHIIEGYVRHDGVKFLLSQECSLWLYLVFDRPNLKKIAHQGDGYLKCPPLTRPFVFAINLPNQLQILRATIHNILEEPWQE